MENEQFGFQDFQDPYNYGVGLDSTLTDPHSVYGRDSFSGWIARKFDSTGSNQWQSVQDKLYEREATNSARAWDWFFDATATQRRVEDLKKAGLNPWLAVKGNGFDSYSSSTAGSGSNARGGTNNKGSNPFIGILALAKLIQVLSY